MVVQAFHNLRLYMFDLSVNNLNHVTIISSLSAGWRESSHVFMSILGLAQAYMGNKPSLNIF